MLRVNSIAAAGLYACAGGGEEIEKKDRERRLRTNEGNERETGRGEMAQNTKRRQGKRQGWRARGRQIGEDYSHSSGGKSTRK